MSEQDGVKSPAEVHAAQVSDPRAVPVEVEALEESGPQPIRTVRVALHDDVMVNVPMQSSWRKSAQDAMRMGDFDTWAGKVLAGDSLDAWWDWMDDDPEMGEIAAFFERLGKATGDLAAGNRASRRASDRMPKR